MHKVTQEDREAAWPFRASQFRRMTYHKAWLSGVYDTQPVIQRFAAHRLSVYAPDRITPEVVEAAAIAAYELRNGAGSWAVTALEIERIIARAMAKAALLAALATLRGDV